MRRGSRSALVWALLLGAALGLRLAAAAWWEARLPSHLRFGFGDSESYWALARTIAHDQPYRFGEAGPQVFRTPGYPLFIAFVVREVGEDLAALVLAQHLLGVITCLLVAGLGISHLVVGADVSGEDAELYAHLCPAGVYERDGDRLVVNGPNCVDCKATDVLGPRWTPREGGSGPKYRLM